MWHKDDSINLNGAISFYEHDHALEALTMIAYSYAMVFKTEHAYKDGRELWEIDLMATNVDPRFVNTLIAIGEHYRCEGTVTYAFNQRLETGIWRNRDFLRMQPINLIDFAVAKLGMFEAEISSKDYDKIKEGWLFQVWNVR